MRLTARQVLRILSIFFFFLSLVSGGPLEDYMEEETMRMQHVILMAGISEWFE